MAASSEDESSDLFKWLDKVWHDILLQSDDEVAVSSFESYIAKDVRVKINHDSITREAFFSYVTSTRATHTMTQLSKKEIKVWEAPGGGGCVVDEAVVVFKHKETGESYTGTVVMVSDVRVGEDGKLTIVETTEVVTRS
ncbi:uncharacterized protein TRIREDRAFT_104220 [Trichoderma reesei QM6a]|uniref:Predicted protein n=2 Tax=Hypocrea jecorina TaxID=51453 RepID=G0RBS8_HYPJQ|nr:uncharacterized protein TRIREDRAFT_104220 [Trichoderma reesei QM6a]EGR51379.1 predicted protein [Trichoderma reesei QM6a]ETS04715.1 hypothetical protein M419DRAFT_73529 [Trichoderma reesei RUT C-30]